MSKNVIITGASGNLGKATVERFLNAGFKVIATVSPGKSLGYETSAKVEVFQVDLTNADDAASFVKDATSKFRSIDAAVLLVGGFGMGKLKDTAIESIRKMIALNFETAYNIAKPVVLKMEETGSGRIILVGSRPGLKSNEGKNSMAYSLSKSLVFKLAEMLNAEYGKKNISTHVIVPSLLDTPENRKAMPDANYADWVKTEDVAETIHFLCSDKGALIRESVVKVYGNS
jgi:NAD(P)-dependent dehydrogenase (short-subunit alcohol dehydrogenase family)